MAASKIETASGTSFLTVACLSDERIAEDIALGAAATQILRSPRCAREARALGGPGLPSYYLLVVKNHTLAVPIWLLARSAASAATTAL
jgi:hypothetical protein